MQAQPSAPPVPAKAPGRSSGSQTPTRRAVVSPTGTASRSASTTAAYASPTASAGTADPTHTRGDVPVPTTPDPRPHRLHHAGGDPLVLGSRHRVIQIDTDRNLLLTSASGDRRKPDPPRPSPRPYTEIGVERHAW